MKPLPDTLAGLRSRNRNGELLLVMMGCALLLMAWRAMTVADFALPPTTARIVTQFIVTVLAGNLALRLTVPEASRQPFALAVMLSAVGVAFVLRLAPESAASQANWVSIGTVAMAGASVAGTRYRTLRLWKYTSAVAAIALLLVTGVFGTTIYGARLWLNVGGFNVQTTEIIKLFLLVFLAGYLADHGAALSSPALRLGGRTYRSLPYLAPLAAVLFLAIAALALLRDLGSVALLVLLTIGLTYVATGRMRFVAGGVALLVATGAAGYVLFGHAQLRIDTWLHPYADAQGAGYQTVQSIYAIQAGGVTGVGLGLGHADNIPAVVTDYVYSSIAEELGLMGAFGVALLYAVLLVSALKVATAARDDFGRLLASAVGLLLAIQAAVIIGGNLRLIPTTGITLPFVSYGGSSIVVNFVLIGLLLGISQTGASGANE